MFIAAIGLAQMFAGPTKARQASLLTGLVAYPAVMIPAMAVAGRDVIDWCVASIFWVPAGYVGGTLVAGIFLIMRWADDRLGRQSDLDLGRHGEATAAGDPRIEIVQAEVVPEVAVDALVLPDPPNPAGGH